MQGAESRWIVKEVCGAELFMKKKSTLKQKRPKIRLLVGRKWEPGHFVNKFASAFEQPVLMYKNK